ncbi:heavy metal translocating P-type ATPase [Xylaria nigripes]|nr:heavy metal translocating P-type ATPase [Xylaria nigripes]
MASSPSSRQFVTIFLVENIHCPTCVSSIKEALREVNGVRHVSPNIITSCVAVEHQPDLPVNEIVSKLEIAGFTVSSGEVAEEERRRAHINNCEQCRAATTTGALATQGTTSNAANEPSGTGASTKDLAQSSTVTTNAHSPSTPNDGTDHPKSWSASLAISGMTCAACANTIRSELDKKDWVKEVNINLVSNSAVVEYLGEKGDVSKVVESIDDLGYGAQLDQVKAVNNNTIGTEGTQKRTVQIYIGGFYCQHCGDRVVTALTGFRRNLRIDKRPTLKSPLLEITYIPQVPTFTVRQILAAIEASDSAFMASIHRPPTLEERAKKIQAQHQRQILLRALLALIVAIPTFIIGIVYMNLLPKDHSGVKYLMAPWVSGISRAQIILFALATLVYFCAADVFHRRAIKEIWSLWRPGSQTPVFRRLYRFGSMNMLISLGTTIAYVASVAQMLAAAAKKPRAVDDGNFYFDSVVFLTMFLLVGRFLEAYSKSKTGDAVEALGKLRPTTAILVANDGAHKNGDRIVGTEMLEFGDVVRVPHGASPPCDGEVFEGSTVFSEASLTGESRPVKKHVSHQVFSGTVNQGTSILVRITGTAGRSMLDQIVKVVREGQTKRAPSEKIADTLVAYFVPAITLIAIITWVVWLVIGLTDKKLAIKEPIPFSLQFAIAVFVVACPCGLALAAPTAIFVGGGLAAAYGILVKGGGEAFETASRVDCVVFDKTGTLTAGGEPSITDYETYPAEGDEEKDHERVLAALQAVEGNSSHPIAKAVVNYCVAKTSAAAAITDVEEIPGKGIKASCEDEGFDILVGNEALMQDYSVVIPPVAATSLQNWKTEAKSVALVAIKANSPNIPDAKYALSSTFSISDPIRPEAIAVVRSLERHGCAVWMLSGDNAVTAQAIALRIGIPTDNVIAGVLPVEKADKIKYLQSVLKARRGDYEDLSRRATIAMVGDGVNDAPALSTADVGIAIGSGSDVAISSADFVLVNSNLASVVTLLELSRKVFHRIKLNFAWALVYNLIAVPLAAGCLYAVEVQSQHVTLDPVWASLAMALSSFSVVMSSLALKTRIPRIGFRPGNLGAE